MPHELADNAAHCQADRKSSATALCLLLLKEKQCLGHLTQWLVAELTLILCSTFACNMMYNRDWLV